jgi:hypothetical protein
LDDNLQFYSELRSFENNGGIEQFNGREGETATLFGRCPSNSNGLAGGFAPRHLNRYASCLALKE